MNKLLLILSCSMFSLLMFSETTHSQDLDPWAYGNLPVKMNLFAFSYSFIDGNIISDPVSPIQDFNITTNKVIAGYLRTFSVFGKLGRVQLMVPFSYMTGDLKISGRDTSGSRTGFDDPRLRIGVNILGSPPLDPAKFRTYRQEAILGLSMVVIIPLGLYYNERVVNLGTNRWGFKPELGLSLRIGQLYVETYGGVRFSTANKEYLVNKTLKQSPIYSVQTHLALTFKNYMKAALSGTYVNGGQTSVNDVNQDDYIRHLRGGVSFGVSITPFHLLTLQLNTNITTNKSMEYKSAYLMYNFIWF